MNSIFFKIMKHNLILNKGTAITLNRYYHPCCMDNYHLKKKKSKCNSHFVEDTY